MLNPTLQAGNYRVLPSVIEEELVQPGQRLERPGEVSDAAAAEQRQEATRRIDFLLRSKLLAVGAASVCGLPLGCIAASCVLARLVKLCVRFATAQPTLHVCLVLFWRRASCRLGCGWCACGAALQRWPQPAANTPLA